MSDHIETLRMMRNDGGTVDDAAWIAALDAAIAALTEAKQQDDDGWEANFRYLLDRSPHTLRSREGGGAENLLHSAILTFTRMEQRLEARQQGPGEAVWIDDLRAVLEAADEASAVPLTWLANTDFTPDQTKEWLAEAVNANVEAGDFSGELHSIAEADSGLVVAFTGCGPKSAANAKFLIWCVHFILKHRDALTAPQVEAKRLAGEGE